jgi:hypothetical protein
METIIVSWQNGIRFSVKQKLSSDGNDYRFLAKRNPFFSETEIIVA